MRKIEDQELDQILGEMHTPEVSPWLKTRVMAEVRQTKQESLFGKILWSPWCRWGAPLSLLAVIALLFFVRVDSPLDARNQMVSDQELEVALDSFFAYHQDEEALWLE